MATGIARTKARRVPSTRVESALESVKDYEWIEGDMTARQPGLGNSKAKEKIRAGISARNGFSCPIFSSR